MYIVHLYEKSLLRVWNNYKFLEIINFFLKLLFKNINLLSKKNEFIALINFCLDYLKLASNN
jgi:hypothetical protein